ncbi:MAG: hypothetical protein ABEJ78_02420 [Haloferacaceae archaeon]
MPVTDIVEDYLLLWGLLSVGVGIAVPSVAVVTELAGGDTARSTVILVIVAVAAALVVAAGLPTIASLPAVVFGVVEMATSAGLAKWYRGTD